MIREITDVFVEHKDDFIAQVQSDTRDYVWYDELLKVALTIVAEYGDFGYGQEPDPNRIQSIDFGDYQGTRVFVVGAVGYQPTVHYVTLTGYGSCSVCDAIQWACAEPEPIRSKELYTLALHMVQRMKEV